MLMFIVKIISQQVIGGHGDDVSNHRDNVTINHSVFVLVM